MHCSACGTPLPEGELHCSGCGTVTPYYYSLAWATPDAPTAMSVSDGGAQQSQSTSSDSTPYQNPYEPSNITPPPPLFQRGSKRLGVRVGVILLSLLLIGGGAFAWLMYLAPDQRAARHYFTAQGTATMLDSNTTNTQQDGNNQISHVTDHWINYGDIVGQHTADEIVTAYPDKTTASQGQVPASVSCLASQELSHGHFPGRRPPMETSRGSFSSFTEPMILPGFMGRAHSMDRAPTRPIPRNCTLAYRKELTRRVGRVWIIKNKERKPCLLGKRKRFSV